MSVKPSSGTTRRSSRAAKSEEEAFLTFSRVTHLPVGPVKARLSAAKPKAVPRELLDDPRVQTLIEWHDGGQPDSEIDLSGAPELNGEQLDEMEKIRIEIARRR